MSCQFGGLFDDVIMTGAMLSASLNGFIGLLATFLIGTYRLEMAPIEITQCVVVSFVSGIISPLLVLKAERTPWIRRHILRGSVQTWIAFASIYFGILLAFAPQARDWTKLTWLAMPLILVTGFSILIFGPIQDRLVARKQRCYAVKDASQKDGETS